MDEIVEITLRYNLGERTPTEFAKGWLREASELDPNPEIGTRLMLRESVF